MTQHVKWRSREDVTKRNKYGMHYCILLLQSKSFIWVGQHISVLVGCIKKLRALYEVQLLETFQIQ